MAGRNIVWITLESVRNDLRSATSRYDPIKNLARLGGDGWSSDRCFSHDIWTRSSSASILTGQAPSAHRTWSNEAKLPDDITTIPERFADEGYRTTCVTSNGQLGPQTGLNRGFERFHGLNKSTLYEETGLRTFADWLFRIRTHSGGFTRDTRRHSLGYLVNRLAYQYVDAAATGDESLFLYVHHNDPHHAYVPPVGWRGQFVNDPPISIEDAIDLSLEMSDRLHEFVAQDDPFTDKEFDALRTLYEASVAYVDHLTGELADYARQRLDDPIIVVTADHGELFGERGLLSHMLVTDTAVSNVPLAVVGLDGLDGLDSDELIQPADVMRMVCTDLGIDHPVPAGQDVREHSREFAVTQRSGERARNKLDNRIGEFSDPNRAEQFHRGTLTTLWTKEWRYQASEERSELFELPDETTDVSGEHPAVADRLEDRRTKWLQDIGQPVGEVETAEFDDELKAHLREMGYLG